MTREPLEHAHREATQSAGWFALDGWDTLRVTGADRASFLHNMCTNDIRGLTSAQGCEAFFTDVKGKIVAHAFAFVDDAAIELVMVPGLARRLVAHLDRYIIREDVQLDDASSEFAWTVVVGREALSMLAEIIDPSLKSLSQPWSHAECSLKALPDIKCRVVRCELLWPGGALVRFARASIREATASLRIQDLPTVELTDDLWHAIRIESAWPLWGVDFDNENLPQEVNRDHLAIHFRKGCYLGQETVARIDALGHVNKKLVQVRFSGDALPQINASLTHGDHEAGRIASAAWSPKFQSPLALAMVRRQFNTAGTALAADSAPGEVL